MNKKLNISWAELRYCIQEDFRKKYDGFKVYGIPRGGTYIAAMIGTAVATPEEADVIVDDLVDSGDTMRLWMKKYPNKQFWAPYIKGQLIEKDAWVIFPWDEENPVGEVGQNVTRILQFIGEDVKREGLQDTPKRYIKFLKEFCSPPEYNMTAFKNEGADQMVMMKDIPFYSLCEHHLAPFFGTAAIGYIPNEKIIGISKLPRTLEKFCRKPQNQERITQQVADYIMKELSPKGVAVVIKARHLCVEMRGVEKPGAETITSAMTGVFKNDLNCRNEFLNLTK